MNNANFLSCNGGGARGRLELDMLQYLYEKMGGAFFRHFDIIGGTSTGSLITALLATGKTPKEISTIYDTELGNIFSGGFCREIIGKSKHSNEYIKELATSLIGDIELGELRQKILIPTVNSSKQETKIFKSYDERDKNYKLVDVIIASSSAPRYFPSHEMSILEKEGYVKQWFKDGGLSSNNPSDILALEGLDPEKRFGKINILSITSGENKDAVTKAEKKGNLLSIPEMIDEILNLQDKKSHGTVETYKKYGLLRGGVYIRCEAEIEESSGGIDDASPKNIKAMKKDAAFSLLQNKSKLDLYHLKTLKND